MLVRVDDVADRLVGDAADRGAAGAGPPPRCRRYPRPPPRPRPTMMPRLAMSPALSAWSGRSGRNARSRPARHRLDRQAGVVARRPARPMRRARKPGSGPPAHSSRRTELIGRCRPSNLTRRVTDRVICSRGCRAAYADMPACFNGFPAGWEGGRSATAASAGWQFPQRGTAAHRVSSSERSPPKRLG